MGDMPSRTKRAPRSARNRAVRQSVTIPGPLASEVRRVAKERQMTMSRALVALAERGVQAELDAKENLQATYRRFMREQEPALKEEAGKDLIRAIFGKDAIAEDPLR
jgi:predicted DNA-binding ribbon-helix-helix protein